MGGIAHENDLHDDIHITATLFNSQKIRKSALIYNEALKIAKKKLFDDFPVITKDLAQHQVALFVRSTDIDTGGNLETQFLYSVLPNVNHVF